MRPACLLLSLAGIDPLGQAAMRGVVALQGARACRGALPLTLLQRIRGLRSIRFHHLHKSHTVTVSGPLAFRLKTLSKGCKQASQLASH